MGRASRVLAVSFLAAGLLFAHGSTSNALAKPRPSRAAHPASQRTKASSGAQRRQTWRNTRSDIKGRFRALGHQGRGKK